ncbi:MAG: hypothetical protein QXL34_03300 [Thermosphaera sp.]
MDRFTVENQVSRSARVLTVASGLATALASVLHLLAALQPLYRFHGLIQGYYSLLSYSLVYTVNQQPVSMPHTDYIQHVSLAYTFSALTLLLVSAASLLLSGRKPLASMGLIYGSSSTLIAVHGLLRNYILRAVELDVARFDGLTGDTVSVETLAGRTVFTGVSIEPTWVHQLASSWLTPIPVVFAAVTSIASIALATRGLDEETWRTRARTPRLSGFTYRLLPALLVLPLLFSQASTFNYQPLSMAVDPQPPPATLEPAFYDYTCTALTRTSRGALTYTDFEAYPVPGWTSYGGAWSTLSGVPGAKGNVLQGQDNNAGVGASSYYYYDMPLSDYTSLWVAVKTRFVSRSEKSQYYGVAMLNADRTRVYAIVLENDKSGIEIRSFGVTKAGWDTHVNQERLPWYSSGAWYTIVVYYSVSGTTINIEAYFYDSAGTLRLSASTTITHRNVFVPAYIGVIADGLTAQYDEFIISTVDPRSVYFAGFYMGMRVEVWDNLGYLVNSTTAPASFFTLGVAGDIVVGTGSDGRIVVRYPDGYLCGELTVPSTDAVLGGDTYALSVSLITWRLGANRTSVILTLNVSGNSQLNSTARILRVQANQPVFARLILDSYVSPASLNLDVWIEAATTSTSISVRSGVPLGTSTSIVQLNIGEGNVVYLSGYFTEQGRSATLSLKLELCSLNDGAGACVRYPMKIVVSS